MKEERQEQEKFFGLSRHTIDSIAAKRKSTFKQVLEILEDLDPNLSKDEKFRQLTLGCGKKPSHISGKYDEDEIRDDGGKQINASKRGAPPLKSIHNWRK